MLLNVVAVVALRPVPHTYAPGNVSAWLDETLAAPGHTTVSGWAFTVGLVCLAAFVAGLAHASRRPWTVTGAVLFGCGALLDAAGTLAPIAALHVERPVGLALLWLTLLLDSAFNALLALGLLAFAAGLGPEDGWPKGLRWLALVAGLVSLPVGLQFLDDAFARLLAVAGPLWLAWVTWASVVLLRRPARA